MIMNKEFINHNKNVDYLRYQERKESLNNSFDRYLQRCKDREAENYSAAIFG